MKYSENRIVPVMNERAGKPSREHARARARVRTLHEPNNANVNPAASNALRATRLLGARPRAHVRPEACPPALRCPPGAFTRSEGRKSSSPTLRERILSVLEVCGCLLGGFRFRRQLLLVAAAGILAGLQGCRTGSARRARAEGSGVVDSSESSHALTRDVLYKLLVGEFASHLGDLTLSLENYLEAARETRDAGVAARAVKMRSWRRTTERALEAGRLWYQFDPSSVEARQVLASLLLRTGDIDAAVEHLDEIVADDGRPTGFGVPARRRAACRREGQRGSDRRHETARAQTREERGGAPRARPATGSGRRDRRGPGDRRARIRAETGRRTHRDLPGARASAHGRGRTRARESVGLSRARSGCEHGPHDLRAHSRGRGALR